MVRLLIFSLAFAFGMPAMAADCGVFQVVKGDVTFKASENESFQKARKNKKVCQGYTVKTASDGRAKIQMADKNEINISPDTELVIEAYKSGQQAVLNVINGKVRSDVKNKYEDSKQSHYRVKTKSAVAGVRGTEFLASYNQVTQESRIVTFEGEVAVGEFKGDSYAPKVRVKPGQFTSNSQGQAPHAPREVPPTELTQMDQESKVDDSGSSKAPASTSQQPEKKPGNDKKDQPNNDKKEQQPNSDKKDQPKSQPQDKKPDPRANQGAKGPNGTGPASSKDGIAAKGDGSDGKVGNGNPGAPPPPNGSREPASTGGGGGLGGLLPPPDLKDAPSAGTNIAELPPPPPVVQQPIFEQIPTAVNNNIINDGVINTNDVVNVIIKPCIVGSTCN